MSSNADSTTTKFPSARDILEINSRISEAEVARDRAKNEVSFWEARIADLRSAKAPEPKQIADLLAQSLDKLAWVEDHFEKHVQYLPANSVPEDVKKVLVEKGKLESADHHMVYLTKTGNLKRYPPKSAKKQEAAPVQ